MGADDPRDFPGLQRKAAEPVASKDQDQDQAGDRPEVTHDLLLADGTSVESSGGIPTHIAVGDRAIPVLSVTERQ
jgi:hypothetical protein